MRQYWSFTSLIVSGQCILLEHFYLKLEKRKAAENKLTAVLFYFSEYDFTLKMSYDELTKHNPNVLTNT